MKHSLRTLAKEEIILSSEIKRMTEEIEKFASHETIKRLKLYEKHMFDVKNATELIVINS